MVRVVLPRSIIVGIAWILLALLPSAAAMEPGPPERRVQSRVYVMTVLVAGLRHHDAKRVWEALAVGDPLELVREPENDADRNAVRVEWNGYPLGYLPQDRNSDVARQLDRGQPLLARITQIAKYRNNRKKLELEIYVEL